MSNWKVTKDEFVNWSKLSTSDKIPSKDHNNILCRLDGLAPFLLKPDVYQKYEEEISPLKDLPNHLGGCWVLVILPSVEKDSIFRLAMILPLRWKKDEAKSDARLPKGLVDLAEKVKEKIGTEALQWTLHPGFDDFPDISDWMSEKDSQSAWFALYAGLWLAMHDLLPNSKVFASGAWNDGVQSVEGLEEKAKVAKEWGAEKFFIPEQCELTGDWPNDFVQKVKNDIKPEKALGEYISDFAEEPKDSASFDQYDQYYAVLKGARKDDRARDFYIRKILPDLVESTLKQANEKAKQKFSKYKNGTLVAWVSAGWEIILVDARIFEVSKVILLLAGDRFQGALEDLKQKLDNRNIKVVKMEVYPEFSEENEIWNLKSKSNLISQENTLIFDLTLGSVAMSLVLQNISDHQQKPLFLYWEKTVDKNNIPIPSTSKLKAWIKK